MHLADGIIRIHKCAEEILLNIPGCLDVHRSVHSPSDDVNARNGTEHVLKIGIPDLLTVFLRHDIEHIQPLVHQLTSELFNAAAGDQFSLDENSDAVGNFLDLIQIVGGDHDGNPVLLGKVTDESCDFTDTGRINAGGRLIHNDDARILHEDIGNSKALAHASGVGACLPVCGVGHPDALQHGDGTVKRLLL